MAAGAAAVAAMAAIAAAGCSFHERPTAQQAVAHVAGVAQLDPDATVRAGGLQLAGGSESFRGTIGFGVRRMSRPDAVDPDPAFGGTFDLGLQASLFGIVSSDRRFDHWLDLGISGAVGGGGAAGVADAMGVARGGGWVEIGLAPGRKHPVLIFGLERAAFSAPWLNQTLFTIGLGWRTRKPYDVGDFGHALAR